MSKIIIAALSRLQRWALETPGFAWLVKLCDRVMGAVERA